MKRQNIDIIDWFAGKALGAIISKVNCDGVPLNFLNDNATEIAEAAYSIADAMESQRIVGLGGKPDED